MIQQDGENEKYNDVYIHECGRACFCIFVVTVGFGLPEKKVIKRMGEIENFGD